MTAKYIDTPTCTPTRHVNLFSHDYYDDRYLLIFYISRHYLNSGSNRKICVTVTFRNCEIETACRTNFCYTVPPLDRTIMQILLSPSIQRGLFGEVLWDLFRGCIKFFITARSSLSSAFIKVTFRICCALLLSA